MDTATDLGTAVEALPVCIQSPMRAALASRAYRIGAFSFETELAVCPITAAALHAGCWSDGRPAAGGPEWGTADWPSDEVQEFAACFDLCAEAQGLAAAISTVEEALARAEDRVLIPTRVRP